MPVKYKTSHSLRLEGRGPLESVVCRHWRGSAHTSALLVLWNALPPPDLWSMDLASLKQHLSSLTALRSYLVLHPHPLAHRKLQESSLPIYFTHLRSKALFGEATLRRFRDFTLSKVTPKLFLCLCFYKKKLPTVSNNSEKALHVSSAPIRRAAARSPARSGPRNGPLNRVTSPGCQYSSPRQGFQRDSKAFKTAEAYVSITACSQN